MKGNRLYKYEKLCSKTAVERLFKEGKGFIAYPLRAVCRFSDPGEYPAGCRFLITVPKKKMRHAVDRVLLRRRIREAYRLNRNHLYPTLENKGKSAEIAFIYLADDIKKYDCIESHMITLLDRISGELLKLTPPAIVETPYDKVDNTEND